jgi:hypothetical protein
MNQSVLHFIVAEGYESQLVMLDYARNMHSLLRAEHKQSESSLYK